jgi:hypothetical protein
MKAYRFEIAWCGGKKFVLACDREEALAKFVDEWEFYGDEAPEHWIVAIWS